MEIRYSRQVQKFVGKADKGLFEKIKVERSKIKESPKRGYFLRGTGKMRKHRFTFKGVHYRILYEINPPFVDVFWMGTRERAYW